MMLIDAAAVLLTNDTTASYHVKCGRPWCLRCYTSLEVLEVLGAIALVYMLSAVGQCYSQ